MEENGNSTGVAEESRSYAGTIQQELVYLGMSRL